MIGDCGLTLQPILGQSLPEIGYHIRADRQRRGYAKKAAAACCECSFTNTPYKKLYSYCKYTNIPSFRTAESIGMRFEAEYPDKDNGITHVSSLTKAEWLFTRLGFTFIKAGPNIAEELLGLCQSADRSSERAPYETYPAREETEESALARGCLYTVKKNGQPAGAAALEERDLSVCFSFLPAGEKACFLSALVLEKESRGLGLGAAPVLRLLEAARERGCGLVRLTVNEKNLPACRCFLSNGFVTVGKAVSGGETFLAMQCLLK